MPIEFKWVCALFAIMFGALAVQVVAKEVGRTARHESCVRHHAPSACAKETD